MMLYVFAGVFCMVLAGTIVEQARKYSVQRALNLPKEIMSADADARQTAERIGYFLMERSEACGAYLHRTGSVSFSTASRIVQRKDESVVALIRMAEHLGCEAVIREKRV